MRKLNRKTAKQIAQQKDIDDDLRYMTIEEYARREGKSVASCKREIYAGLGPKVTQLSPRRIGIRYDHYKQHAERRIIRRYLPRKAASAAV